MAIARRAAGVLSGILLVAVLASLLTRFDATGRAVGLLGRASKEPRREEDHVTGQDARLGRQTALLGADLELEETRRRLAEALVAPSLLDFSKAMTRNARSTADITKAPGATAPSMRGQHSRGSAVSGRETTPGASAGPGTDGGRQHAREEGGLAARLTRGRGAKQGIHRAKAKKAITDPAEVPQAMRRPPVTMIQTQDGEPVPSCATELAVEDLGTNISGYRQTGPCPLPAVNYLHIQKTGGGFGLSILHLGR